MIKLYKIEDELYHFKLNVLIGGNYEALRTMILEGTKMDLGESEHEQIKGMFFDSTNHKLYFLWVGKGMGKAVLAHEVFHLVHHIFKIKGMTLSDDSQEAYAHYIEWWMNVIQKETKPRRRPLTKKKKSKVVKK